MVINKIKSNFDHIISYTFIPFVYTINFGCIYKRGINMAVLDLIENAVGNEYFKENTRLDFNDSINEIVEIPSLLSSQKQQPDSNKIVNL
ncbi:hypothetical protein LLB_1152 [Legionella longbeachae D-4968]|nr:hypothetical protein LLB_1152 [Legionella longbeachae D-4968]